MEKLIGSLERSISSILSGRTEFINELTEVLNIHSILRVHAWKYMEIVSHDAPKPHLMSVLIHLIQFAVQPGQGEVGKSILTALPPKLCLELLQYDNDINRSTSHQGVMGWMHSMYLLFIVIISTEDEMIDEMQESLSQWCCFLTARLEEAVHIWSMQKLKECHFITCEDECIQKLIKIMKQSLMVANSKRIVFHFESPAYYQLLDLIEVILRTINPDEKDITSESNSALPGFIFETTSKLKNVDMSQNKKLLEVAENKNVSKSEYSSEMRERVLCDLRLNFEDITLLLFVQLIAKNKKDSHVKEFVADIVIEYYGVDAIMDTLEKFVQKDDLDLDVSEGDALVMLVIALIHVIVPKAVECLPFRENLVSCSKHPLPKQFIDFSVDLRWTLRVWRLLSELEQVTCDGSIAGCGEWMLGYVAGHQQLDCSRHFVEHVASSWFPRDGNFGTGTGIAPWTCWLIAVMTAYVNFDQEHHTRSLLNKVAVETVWKWCDSFREPFHCVQGDESVTSQGEDKTDPTLVPTIVRLISRLLFRGDLTKSLRVYMISHALTSAREGGWMLASNKFSSLVIKTLNRVLTCVGFTPSNACTKLNEEIELNKDKLDIASVLLEKLNKQRSKGTKSGSVSQYSQLEGWYFKLVTESSMSLLSLIRDRIPWEAKHALYTIQYALIQRLELKDTQEDERVFISSIVDTMTAALSNILLPLPGAVPALRNSDFMNLLMVDLQKGLTDSSYGAVVGSDMRSSVVMEMLTKTTPSMSTSLDHSVVKQQASVLLTLEHLSPSLVDMDLLEYLIQPSSVTMVPTLRTYSMPQLQLRRLQLVASICYGKEESQDDTGRLCKTLDAPNLFSTCTLSALDLEIQLKHITSQCALGLMTPNLNIMAESLLTHFIESCYRSQSSRNQSSYKTHQVQITEIMKLVHEYREWFPVKAALNCLATLIIEKSHLFHSTTSHQRDVSCDGFINSSSLSVGIQYCEALCPSIEDWALLFTYSHLTEHVIPQLIENLNKDELDSHLVLDIWIDILFHFQHTSSQSLSVFKSMSWCLSLASLVHMYLSVEACIYQEKPSDRCRKLYLISETLWNDSLSPPNSEFIIHYASKSIGLSGTLKLLNLSNQSAIVLLQFTTFIKLILTSASSSTSSSSQCIMSKKEMWLSNMLNVYRILSFDGSWCSLWCSLIDILFQTQHCESNMSNFLSTVSIPRIYLNHIKGRSTESSFDFDGVLSTLEEIAVNKQLSTNSEDMMTYWCQCWLLVFNTVNPTTLSGCLLTLSVEDISTYTKHGLKCMGHLIAISTALTEDIVLSEDYRLAFASHLYISMLTWVEHACSLMKSSSDASTRRVELEKFKRECLHIIRASSSVMRSVSTQVKAHLISLDFRDAYQEWANLIGTTDTRLSEVPSEPTPSPIESSPSSPPPSSPPRSHKTTASTLLESVSRKTEPHRKKRKT